MEYDFIHPTEDYPKVKVMYSSNPLYGRILVAYNEAVKAQTSKQFPILVAWDKAQCLADHFGLRQTNRSRYIRYSLNN